jgi:hypothetical protein
MIRNSGSRLSIPVSLLTAIFFHVVVLLFVKKNTIDFSSLQPTHLGSQPIRVNNIQLIRPDEIPQMKKVGIKNGAKNKYFQPDQLKILPPPAVVKTPGLSLNNLAPVLPKPVPNIKPEEKAPKAKAKSNPLETMRPANLSSANDSSATHFYFNPKKEKKIARNEEQDNLKQEAYKNVTASSSNPVAQKLSNFEIRYERPEGVSEDELNSDEKAYYSFFKRSYASYLSKLYATYEKIAIERPALEKDFEGKHLLIGRIDYDEKGNIVTVKILKSSESDNVHYFFEETLKQLNLPNPPKSFVKNKKSFSTYYQIQIN